MNKINQYIYLSCCLLMLAACNKQLNTAPTNAVPGDLVFQNVSNLSTIYQGAWASLMDDFYGNV